LEERGARGAGGIRGGGIPATSVVQLEVTVEWTRRKSKYYIHIFNYMYIYINYSDEE